MKWKRNPDYWKKDQYGNQLPYLDGIILFQANNTINNEMLIGRRLDIKNTLSGAATLNTWKVLTEGAPELLWQKRDRDDNQCLIFINMDHPPLDDIRVRRAMGLVLEESELILGYSGTDKFGMPDTGLLAPSYGLPKEEVIKLMGWDKPYEKRVAEAQKLMAEAGYPTGLGYKLNILSLGGRTSSQGGASHVFADQLYKALYIESDVQIPGKLEVFARVDEDNYDIYATTFRVGQNPVFIKDYFGTDGNANHSNYSNPELDKLLDEIDQIIDPDKRREAIWEIERILLTDLPGLPAGCFIGNMMPYYPHVKNIRWNNLSYGNHSRLEDVWIDESLRVK